MLQASARLLCTDDEVSQHDLKHDQQINNLTTLSQHTDTNLEPSSEPMFCICLTSSESMNDSVNNSTVKKNFSSRSFFVAALTLESTLCAHYSC